MGCYNKSEGNKYAGKQKVKHVKSSNHLNYIDKDNTALHPFRNMRNRKQG